MNNHGPEAVPNTIDRSQGYKFRKGGIHQQLLEVKAQLTEYVVWKLEPSEQEISHKRSQGGHCKPATR
jgi:hypothetical protein